MNNPIFAFVLSVFIVALVLVYIRRGKLKEKYAILWLLVALVSSAAVIFPETVFRFASSFGFEIPANFLFSITLLISLFLIFLLSTDISKKQRQIENLATELAIIKNQLKK
jgi:hypothetical protein